MKAHRLATHLHSQWGRSHQIRTQHGIKQQITITARHNLNRHGFHHSATVYQHGNTRSDQHDHNQHGSHSSSRGPSIVSPFSSVTGSTNTTSPHNSLSTFLSYTAKQGSSRTSTTYQGTLYEYMTLTYLMENLGFELHRVGGRNDWGIDLLGSWNLLSTINTQQQQQPPLSSSSPSSASPPSGSHQEGEHVDVKIPVLIQCKRVARATPTLIRELEGSFLAAPAEWRRTSGPVQTLGIMVCTRPATKGIREAMGRSHRGLAYMMLEEDTSDIVPTDSGESKVDSRADDDIQIPRLKLRQFLWNAAAGQACGLQGLSVGLRYGQDHAQDQEVNLCWQGNPITFSNSSR